MADEPKDKEEKKPSTRNPLLEIVGLVLAVAIISNMITNGIARISDRPSEDMVGVQNEGAELVGIDRDGDGYIDEYVYDTSTGEIQSDSALRRFFADPSFASFMRIIRDTVWYGWFITAYAALTFVLYGISAAFIVWIIYLRRQLSIIEDKQKEELDAKLPEDVPIADPSANRWETIRERVQAPNPEGWKIAILEADIILEEILDINGYKGASIGEKLKGVEPADLASLNDAWEAHKVRNAIAHEGDAFQLSQREAERVIKLYEKVFREYGYI